MSTRLLRIYLQDHFAASDAGVALARRVHAANAEGAFGRELWRLAEEVAADRWTLAEVLRRLDVEPSVLKGAAARISERLARGKPNGRLTGYSPLSRVLELEALAAGITAKAALWRSLEVTLGGRLGDIDFRELHRSAVEQARRAEQLRVEAARLAFEQPAAPAQRSAA
jgi:hypothetical protein